MFKQITPTYLIRAKSVWLPADRAGVLVGEVQLLKVLVVLDVSYKRDCYRLEVGPHSRIFPLMISECLNVEFVNLTLALFLLTCLFIHFLSH